MSHRNLYTVTQLTGSIYLLPQQIDGNIDQHILTNLKSDVENHVIDNGIVIRANKLINYSNGVIGASNFMATTVFDVTYECILCAPVVGMEFICQVKNILPGFVLAENGPVTVIIMMAYIDEQQFSIKDNNSIVFQTTGAALAKEDYIKVSIINISSNLGEDKIATICKLINMASEREIKSFADTKTMITSEMPDDDLEYI